MQAQQAYDIVVKYLSEEFEIPRERITPEARLGEDLELDSIDALDLASQMQSELGVAVNREELKAIRTVQDVVDYIVHNLPN
ncbi:MAG: acyl carrier protein [Deltaproteobacteria bacterium]|nr:acyl carrier protein [Deltaproteobacteria bacterium]